MNFKHVAAALTLAALAATGPGTALGQAFPNKPIRMVTAEPGGGGDFAARIISQALSASIGQPVLVDNRGGIVVVAVDPVVKAQPDGYTVLLFGNNVWLLPFLQAGVPYDPVKDLAPVTIATQSPNALVVPASLPVNSVSDLIALAKSKPGQLNFGTSGTGSTNHLSGELLKAMAGIDIVRINYKGIGAGLNDLLAGKIHLMMPTIGAVITQVKAGKLRLLAVSSAKPSALAPGVPTMIGSGMRGFESSSMLGLFAPARTPAAVVNRLYQETARVLNQPDIRDRFLSASIEPVGSTPAELGAFIQEDMARWGKVIKDAGIQGN